MVPQYIPANMGPIIEWLLKIINKGALHSEHIHTFWRKYEHIRLLISLQRYSAHIFLNVELENATKHAPTAPRAW